MPDMIDTHCHIHHKQYKFDIPGVIQRAKNANVTKMICVGVNDEDSTVAIEFANQHDGCYASIGLHPHDANQGQPTLTKIASLTKESKVVAIGECGLDYFNNKIDKSDQEKVLRFQIELALEHDLPLIIHIRDAYPDFWRIFDEYSGVRGVAHCFNAGPIELEQVLNRNLYVGLNGIMTFSKDQQQLEAARFVPIEKLLLETDAPFLTPEGYRGKVNEPKYIGDIAKFLSELRQEELGVIQKATTLNAISLFELN